ncbi:bacterial Ig-like domain-containing protein [Listeria kieliensis]
MTAKNWLKLLPILLVLGIGLFFIPHLFAENRQVDDLQLASFKTKVDQNEIFSLQVVDKQPGEQKVYLPIPNSFEYIPVHSSQAAVTFDKINHQLVIDWEQTKQKTITIQLKAHRKGEFSFKLFATRNEKTVESKPVTFKVQEPQIYNAKQSDSTFQDKKVKPLDLSLPEIYSISNGYLQAFDNQAMIQNKIVLNGEIPIKNLKNQLGWYNNKLYILDHIGSEFSLYEVKGDGTYTKTVVGKTPCKSFVGGGISKSGVYVAMITSPDQAIQLILVDVKTKKLLQVKNIVFPTPNDQSKLTMTGDMAFDGDGTLWKVSYKKANGILTDQYLQKIDIQSAKVLKTLQLKIPFTVDSNYGYSGIAFLSNGEMLLGSGVYGRGSFSKIDMGTGEVKAVGPKLGAYGTYDLASPFYPYFNTHLTLSMQANPTSGAGVYQRKEIEYTLTFNNLGNLASSHSLLSTTLPEGTEYVPNSTKLDGETVKDIAGTSPLFSGMEVSSKGSLQGIISKNQKGTVNFKVRVKANTPPNSTVTNQAELSAENTSTIQSNMITHTVLLNQSELKVKNSSIKIGQTWNPKDNFVSAKKPDGSAISFDLKAIQVNGTVNTHKLGKYTVFYQNQDIEQKAIISVDRLPAPTINFSLKASNQTATKEDQRILLGDSLTLQYELQNQTANSGFRAGQAKWRIPLPIGVEPTKLSDLLTLTGPNGDKKQVPWDSLYDSKSRTLCVDKRNFDPNWLKLSQNNSIALNFNVKVNSTDAMHIVGTKLSSTPSITGTDYNGDQLTLKSPAPLDFGPIFSGALQFYDVPNTLAFQNGWIQSFTSEISREDPNWKIVVEDTRRRSKNWNNNWQVTVRQVSPFKTKQKDVLTNILIFKRNASSEQIISEKNSTIVFDGKSNTADFYDVLWAKNQGLFLKVPPGAAKAKQIYQSIIEWNLSNSPL